jgi:serine/threonine-protein kinase
MFFGGGGDPRSDLYSLGVVGYRLLTGSPPFTAENVGELIRHHLTTVPEPPSARKPDVPGDLEVVILACLMKEPDDRPPSAVALRRRLLDCADAGRWTERSAREWWEENVPRESERT